MFFFLTGKAAINVLETNHSFFYGLLKDFSALPINFQTFNRRNSRLNLIQIHFKGNPTRIRKMHMERVKKYR